MGVENAYYKAVKATHTYVNYTSIIVPAVKLGRYKINYSRMLGGWVPVAVAGFSAHNIAQIYASHYAHYFPSI